MSRGCIDLYIAGDLGNWALTQIAPSDVNVVITSDNETREKAHAAGFAVEDDRTAAGSRTCGQIALSVHYPKILSSEILKKYRGAYNLHPGYLPWGRGYYPIFWALLDNTPAGATLHQMTERVDAGPIVDQTQVPYSGEDTGGSLFERVREAEKELFTRHWPTIQAGTLLKTRPQEGAGSYHSRAQFFEMKRPTDWKALSGESLVKRIRCLTFAGYTGLELQIGGRRVHLVLQDMT